MTDLLAELRWRGLLQDATPGLTAHLREPRVAYCGFDPTAPSLQLGNLVPLMLLRHLQAHGHTPIVLMGGGTGLIGDPSGKRTERPLLPRAELRAHLEQQRAQMERFLRFDGVPNAARMRDNAEWLEPATLVTFLRDVGKHFTVNVMLQKESVKARLESGLSYTEFSYMLLQAFDFLELHRREGCTLQVGGSDQWGNITAGVDLIRRVAGAEAHALVAPLVSTVSGVKFGKSEAGAIFLDPALTSPYKFYQFWINTDDRDVEGYLKLFTLKNRDDVQQIIKQHKSDPAKRRAQRYLAEAVSIDVHGVDATHGAREASEILFGERDPREAHELAIDALLRELPSAPPSAGDGMLVDHVIAAGLAKSKSEARRTIAQGGIYVNGDRETDVDLKLDRSYALHGKAVLLRKGKRDYAIVPIQPT
jgi:tyrosyl-tRNA synthetase